MTQDEIDRAEWENEANWSHPLFGVYFSKRDSRTWVPKRTPSWGWTLNLGRPSAVWWIVGLITVPMVLARTLGRGRRD
jgi:uncharacterized membrane protein